MDLNIEKFEPTTAELTKMAIIAQSLTKDSDLGQIKVVRLQLRGARTAITKMGKEMREDAVGFQRAVIAKEKELVAIIEPEEERLKAIEDEAQRIKDLEDRKEFLPRRRERLTAIGDGIETTDDELLNLDGTEFEALLNKRMADRNETDRLKLIEDQRKVDEEKNKLAHEKEVREAEDRGRKEAAEKAAHDATEKKIREEFEAREAEEKAKMDAVCAEEKELADQKRLEAQTKYRAFRKKCGWTEDTQADFREERDGDQVVLWKKVGTFKIEK